MPFGSRVHRDYSPVHWSEYFDEAHDVTLNHEISSDVNSMTDNSTEDSFRVYLRNFNQPYAPSRIPGQPLDPNGFEITESELQAFSRIPTLVMLHGGGYSGLTWAHFTRNIEQQCKCRVLALDLRAHGDTKTNNEAQMDIDTLIDDVTEVIHKTHQKICGFRETPKLVLVGHSMGGAIAIKCAYKCAESLPSLSGFVVIDVVEGTAKDALPQMMSVIKTRPVRFPSLANAIEWSVRSGMAKNANAARVSMPGNLLNIASGQLATHDIKPVESHKIETIARHKFHIGVEQLIGRGLPSALLPPRLPLPRQVQAIGGASVMPVDSSAIQEESISLEEDNADSKTEEVSYKKPTEVDKTGFTWRTNLAKTQPHWNGWFEGLSEQMLQSQVQGKFLLLAGIDRLDKTLTIGQMQGKFMMKVLPKCGHAVHEDVPDLVASAISDFLIRNKFTEAVG